MRVGFGVYLQVRLNTQQGPENSVNVLMTAEGNGLNVAKVMPESAIKFGAYEVCLPGQNERFLWTRRLIFFSLQNVHLLGSKAIMTPKNLCQYRSSCQGDVVEWLLSKLTLH